MSIKSYKYRFYPTEAQEQLLAQTFGCVRVVYNKALVMRTSTYKETGKGASFGDTSSALTQWKKDDDFQWLREVSCVPLQQTLRHLNTAFVNFFNRRAKYPKFKSKKSRQSAEFTRSGFTWNATAKSLSIAKIGKLDIRWSRHFSADPSTVTISKTSTGKYFVSIRIDEPNRIMPEATTKIGIDLGIENLAITSEGEFFKNQRLTNQFAAKLRRAQRTLSRRVKGSARWNRARQQVALIQEKIANSRRDWVNKATTQLIRDNQAIYVETLKPSNMMKNRKLSKAIADCSWFEFVCQLEYKAGWYGRTFAKVSQWEPTSKRCSCCGHVVTKLPLNIRAWNCPKCKEEHHRDVNAAKNILAAGLAVTAQGEIRRPLQDSSCKGRSRRTVNHSEAKHLNVKP